MVCNLGKKDSKGDKFEANITICITVSGDDIVGEHCSPFLSIFFSIDRQFNQKLKFSNF